MVTSGVDATGAPYTSTQVYSRKPEGSAQALG